MSPLRGVGSLLALVLTVLLGGTAVAEPVTCPPGQAPHPRTGQCRIVVISPGPSPGPRPGPDPVVGPRDPAPAPPAAPRVCRWDGENPQEVPCESGFGSWSQSRQCYVQLIDPAPPYSDPEWEGRTEGSLYTCTPPYWVDIGLVPIYTFWSASPPDGVAPPPDPRVLAQQAITTMNLSAISIGLVPEPVPGSVGLVGLPVWMWVDTPSENTWGPITRSASAAGWTVTATAQVSQVSWDMGDGQVITCGEGTAYQDAFGTSSSPTCGHTYTRQGEYTVRATSHWVITWAGIGQSGTIAMDLVDTAPVAIGEVQVLRKR